MNCDDAFECLTDPTRQDCDELKWHLDLCSRCRQMKEVLAPALQLFSPSPGDDFGRTSPADSGLDLEQTPEPASRPLPVESILLAERTAEQLARQRENPQGNVRRNTGLGTLVRLTAVFLLGAAVTFAGITWKTRRERPSAAEAPYSKDGACLWLNRDAEPVRTERPTDARHVVLSCNDCHLRHTLD